MNKKKQNILDGDMLNFIEVLRKLSLAYGCNTEVNLFRYPCIVERNATRLYTHFEDWTTINNDLAYEEKINKCLQSNIKGLHKNLIQFIKEQQAVDAMMYYTHKLLSYAKII